MKTSQLFKKLIWVIPITFLFLLSFTLVQANAASHESPWVLDNAKVLNQRTIKRIDDLNKNQLSKIKGHPQYAVITVDGIPDDKDDIEDYTHDEGNKLKIGHKGWHNGMLFVLDTKQHQYRLEIGTGLQSALPDASKNKIITTKVESQLHRHNYNQAVSMLSENTYQLLYHNRAEISSQRNKEDGNQFVSMLFDIVIGIAFVLVVIQSLVSKILNPIRKKKFNKQYQEMVQALKKPDVKQKLEENQVKYPKPYLDSITAKERHQLFAHKTLDTTLLVSLIVAAYLRHQSGEPDSHDHDHHDGGFFGGFFSGLSDDSGSFGDSFDGDSGGFDGGGFDGDF